MLLLIIASTCFAASVFVVGQAVTQPERDRRSLVRRAAAYGRVRTPQAFDERLPLTQRVVAPIAGRGGARTAVPMAAIVLVLVAVSFGALVLALRAKSQ